MNTKKNKHYTRPANLTPELHELFENIAKFVHTLQDDLERKLVEHIATLDISSISTEQLIDLRNINREALGGNSQRSARTLTTMGLVFLALLDKKLNDSASSSSKN